MSARHLRADTARTRRIILDCLRSFPEGHHPTTGEIAAKCGISHTTVRRHIDALIAEGKAEVRERPTVHVRREIVLLPDAPDGGGNAPS